MFIPRDLFHAIEKKSQLESLLLWGPRQVGKTTLLDQLPLASKVFLDDLAYRQRAQNDPALFLQQLKLPCLIDEAQYAPHLFSEIKLHIDTLRRKQIKQKSKKKKTLFYLTGSNRTLLDQNVKESLAGRATLLTLHGLSVREIINFSGKKFSLQDILFRGGFPELYTHTSLSIQRYLNDYILSFIEKDLAYTSGVSKINEFHSLLRLLAARSGQFLNINELASASGIDNKTVTNWIALLQRNTLLEMVTPYHSNLSKRITKMKKLYFYDTGLCIRLQGHLGQDAMWNSPHSGSLFETLVFSEIMKTRDHHVKDWQLNAWRTKDQNEIDFILSSEKETLFIEAKMAIHGAKPFELDPEALKIFKPPHHKIVVTAGGKQVSLGNNCQAIPLPLLGDYLLEHL